MSKIRVGQLLDLIDSSRKSRNFIHIMGDNGEVECKAMVGSEIWDALEDRTVNSIQVEDNALEIWLDAK